MASNISVHFPETDHDYLSTQLSERGVFVSTTSACQSGTGTATVLSALPGSADQALRITLGVDASQEQVDRLLGALKAVVAV